MQFRPDLLQIVLNVEIVRALERVNVPFKAVDLTGDMIDGLLDPVPMVVSGMFKVLKLFVETVDAGGIFSVLRLQDLVHVVNLRGKLDDLQADIIHGGALGLAGGIRP